MTILFYKIKDFYNGKKKNLNVTTFLRTLNGCTVATVSIQNAGKVAKRIRFISFHHLNLSCLKSVFIEYSINLFSKV